MKNWELMRTRKYKKLIKENPDIKHKVLTGEELAEALKDTLIERGESYAEYGEYADLLDIEELVRLIATPDDWAQFWVDAKIVRSKLDLNESIEQFKLEPIKRRLLFVQSAIFKEVKNLKKDYINFQKARITKRNREGGFSSGCAIIREKENILGK